MRGTRLWLVIGLVALLGCGLFVAACGDDDDETTTSADSGGSSTELDLLSEGTLTVGSDIPYPPFEQGNAPDYEGFDIDLINAIAEEMGLETEIVDAPVRRHPRRATPVASTSRSPRPRSPTRARTGSTSPIHTSSPSSRCSCGRDGEIASIDDLTADTVVGGPGRDHRRDSTRSITPTPRCGRSRRSTTPTTPSAGGQVDAVINDLSSTSAAVERQPRLRGRRDLPDRRAVRDRLPAGLEPRRAGQRGAADGQGRRHPRATSTHSGSTPSSRSSCSARPTSRAERSLETNVRGRGGACGRP